VPCLWNKEMIVQLDLFKSVEEAKQEELFNRVESIHQSTEKVRRGLFARHNELAKMYLELSQRLEYIERHICKGGQSCQEESDPKI